jgi:hypothetical protein
MTIMGIEVELHVLLPLSEKKIVNFEVHRLVPRRKSRGIYLKRKNILQNLFIFDEKEENSVSAGNIILFPLSNNLLYKSGV